MEKLSEAVPQVQAVLDPRKTTNKLTGYRWNLLCRYALGSVLDSVFGLQNFVEYIFIDFRVFIMRLWLWMAL